MPRLLELMAGTGSIGKAFRALGWETVSLDMDPKTHPDIVADVLTWDPGQPDAYDCVWCSPPCTEFSRALTTRPRDLDAGRRVVARCLEIIQHLRPKIWFMEYPGTGLLPRDPLVSELPFKMVTYCKYGSDDHRYRKLTWIATNALFWTPQPVCCKASPCEWLEEGRHPECAQRGPTKCKQGWRGGHCTQKQLYSMPPKLCLEIAEVATFAAECTT
jgi:hypothetical protein